MNTVNPEPNTPGKVPRIHEATIRVRYQETDAQGRVHHANYINYFEIGRVEMLRASGTTYRELEQSGHMLVVTDLQCKYLLPAYFDDTLRLVTTIIQAKGVRIRHRYEIFRDKELLVVGETTVACIDPDGKPKRLPKWLRSK